MGTAIVLHIASVICLALTLRLLARINYNSYSLFTVLDMNNMISHFFFWLKELPNMMNGDKTSRKTIERFRDHSSFPPPIHANSLLLLSICIFSSSFSYSASLLSPPAVGLSLLISPLGHDNSLRREDRVTAIYGEGNNPGYKTRSSSISLIPLMSRIPTSFLRIMALVVGVFSLLLLGSLQPQQCGKELVS